MATNDAQFTTDGIAISISWEKLTETLTAEARRELLAHLACDDIIFLWCIEQLAYGFFAPDDEAPASWWSTDGFTLERARARFDEVLPDVAEHRIRDLKTQMRSEYRRGAGDAQRAIADAMGLSCDSRLWSTMCDATRKLYQEES
jgi:hypothetical protein